MNKKTMLLLNNICTWIFYPSFAALLIWMAAWHHNALWRTVLVCDISFVVLSVYRHLRNAPRPYETNPDIEPPTPKCRNGHSFPSRHVFSAWIIIMAYLYSLPWWGVPLMIPGVALAYLRAALHFHHISDVVVGALCGIVAGVVGFWIL